MDKIKVMVVDDHPVVRQGLKQLLELNGEIVVVGEADTGLECLQLIKKGCPDLIFLDISMPGISGIETARLISKKFPQVKIVFLTVHEDAQSVAEAIRVGAKGYILKKVNRDALMRAVHHVMADGAFLDPTVTSMLFEHLKKDERTSDEEPERSQRSLSKRELEILKGIVEGHTDRQIAKSLFISEHTVRSHIKNVYRKLGVSSRSQAVGKALHDEIIRTG